MFTFVSDYFAGFCSKQHLTKHGMWVPRGELTPSCFLLTREAPKAQGFHEHERACLACNLFLPIPCL